MNKLHSDRLDIFANTEIPAEEDILGSLVIYTDGSYVEEELRAGNNSSVQNVNNYKHFTVTFLHNRNWRIF